MKNNILYYEDTQKSLTVFSHLSVTKHSRSMWSNSLQVDLHFVIFHIEEDYRTILVDNHVTVTTHALFRCTSLTSNFAMRHFLIKNTDSNMNFQDYINSNIMFQYFIKLVAGTQVMQLLDTESLDDDQLSITNTHR